MFLVGTPLHAGSVDGLARLLPVWDHWHRVEGRAARFMLAINGSDCHAVLQTVFAYLAPYPELPIRVTATGPGSGECEWSAQVGSQRAIVAAAIEGGFSHLLWHEASRVPLPGALDYLLAAGLPVAGALYKDAFQPGYYCVFDPELGIERQRHAPYLRIDEIRVPTRVPAVGFGFTLIETGLLSRVNLRVSPGCAADTYFYFDLQRLGVPVYACPVFAYSSKVDGNPELLPWWQAARARLLAEDAARAG